MRNLHLTFDYSTDSQKLGEDFAKFCGLLRICELKSVHAFLKNLFTIVIRKLFLILNELTFRELTAHPFFSSQNSSHILKVHIF